MSLITEFVTNFTHSPLTQNLMPTPSLTQERNVVNPRLVKVSLLDAIMHQLDYTNFVCSECHSIQNLWPISQISHNRKMVQTRGLPRCHCLTRQCSNLPPCTTSCFYLCLRSITARCHLYTSRLVTWNSNAIVDGSSTISYNWVGLDWIYSGGVRYRVPYSANEQR